MGARADSANENFGCDSGFLPIQRTDRLNGILSFIPAANRDDRATEPGAG